MDVFSLLAGEEGGVANTSELSNLYRSLINHLKGSSLGDLTYNPGGATTYAFGRYLIAENLTIGSLATLQGDTLGSGKAIICDTLTMNGGVIDANGYSGSGATSGAAAGGNAGTNLFIFARQIIGTGGTIKANGLNGVTPVAAIAGNGGSGAGGNFTGIGSTSNGGTGGNTAAGTGGAALPAILPAADYVLRFPSWISNLLKYQAGLGSTGTRLDQANFYGAGGAASAGTTTSTANIGGGGGGGSYGAGGNANWINNVTQSSCGGGGGGGGYIYIFTESALPAGLTIQANGGNGGNGFGNGSGGGGGGGGAVLAFAPSNAATLQANGGAAGIHAGLGLDGSAGGAGLAEWYPFRP